MSDKLNEFGTTYWAKSLDDVDREIARYATMCNVRILDPGVIERVLKRIGERLGGGPAPRK